MKSHSKKYSKYLTGIASAALVASAVAPVVSAADFNDVLENNSHKEAIDALSTAGVISGYPDGSFKPNKTLTRSDVVKLMGKWLVSMGYEIPKDYKTKPRFTDLTANSNDELLQSAAIVKDNNVFRGYEDGSLNAAGSITRENMAIVLIRAYDSVNKTDLLTYVQNQEFDKDVVDLTLAKAEARPAINVLDFFDITNPAAPNFRPKETTTRAQFASFLYKTIQVKVPVEETPEVAEVTSVEAPTEKGLVLNGKNLELLKAEQLKIEDNEIASYTANKEGTQAVIELKNELTSGKEMTLTVTTKAEGEEDVVTPFKFTYELKVGKVVGTTTQLNALAEGQVLTFTVDGAPANLKKLKDAGYTVEFQSTKSDLFKDKATGELQAANLVAGQDFSYKVVVSKDGNKVESELVEVKVLNYDSYVSEISEITITQGNVNVESAKVPLESGKVNVKATKATTLNGATLENPSATYTSSNPSVATVNSVTGEVTLVSPGEVNIIIKVDHATKNVPLTVVSGQRVASKVVASSAETKLIKDATQGINLVVTDQYGDEFTGQLTVETKDATIATATIDAVTAGKSNVTVKAVAPGTTDIQVKSGDTVLSTIKASVSEDTTVATRKLETKSASDDFQLDVMKGSEDQKVTLVWNKYNAQGFLVGPETDAKYVVTSSDPTIATVTNTNGDINVTAVKKGSTELLIKEGDVTRATATITVVDSTPVITAVKFENVEPVTKAGVIGLPILKSEGITLTSSKVTPEITSDGVIYIDVNGNGYNINDDITLGSIARSYSGAANDITNLQVTAGTITGTVNAGAKGTIVVSVTPEGKTVPVGTKAIEVNVPAQ
ncbi:S-layer homology domain-containing protein [Sporosarcina sp. GW1-11]|uniref:S-layer homology domain-containing protein n=1 Tax=Sporosarcina sp. GW1-11 TaxID=2899126 RepID=UPI00294D6995|nr:S-layer homology domain-containing protein [Sporosarcina sp. GW1-11]MDV6379059.1 S-layer homology domain-containing protein [Sporosarcina sp. GW1-11]